MGPPHEQGGKGRRRAPRRTRERASMGPPHEQGGKATSASATGCAICSCFNGAPPRTGGEGPAWTAPRSGPPRFNGAPPRTGGEGGAPVAATGGNMRLQWGPPTNRGGRAGRYPRAKPGDFAASMGPPHEQGGKGGSGALFRGGTYASMGPPHEQGGKGCPGPGAPMLTGCDPPALVTAPPRALPPPVFPGAPLRGA